jgi:plastocyanin
MKTLVRLNVPAVLFACLVISGAALSQQSDTPPGVPATGGIRGRITFANGPADEHAHAMIMGRYGDHGTKAASPMPHAEDTVKIRMSENTVVYLTDDELDHGTYQLPGKNPVLNQKGLQFHPHVLPILARSTVDFPNRDNLFHNVFSYSQTKEFDLGRYPLDDSRSVTFDRPGVVRVYCDIHAHMNATILVLRNPYFTVPDDNGVYRLMDVPEGKHTLVVWHDRDIAGRVTIEIRAGRIIEQDLTF